VHGLGRLGSLFVSLVVLSTAPPATTASPPSSGASAELVADTGCDPGLWAEQAEADPTLRSQLRRQRTQGSGSPAASAPLHATTVAVSRWASSAMRHEAELRHRDRRDAILQARARLGTESDSSAR